MDSDYISFGLIGIIRLYWYSIYQPRSVILVSISNGCQIDTDNTRRRKSNILPVHGKSDNKNRAPRDSDFKLKTHSLDKNKTQIILTTMVWQRQYFSNKG